MTTYDIMKAAVKHSPEIKWGHVQDGLAVSRLMVCKSAAGYYPGRMCFDVDVEFVEPYSRAKIYGYFPNETLAQKAVDEAVF